MTVKNFETMDGNEAVARVAFQLNEVVALFPITPASPMGEWADAWAAAGVKNLWGTVPAVIEMQSEAGAIHPRDPRHLPFRPARRLLRRASCCRAG